MREMKHGVRPAMTFLLEPCSRKLRTNDSSRYNVKCYRETFEICQIIHRLHEDVTAMQPQGGAAILGIPYSRVAKVAKVAELLIMCVSWAVQVA
jgi:hypothetical protein